MDVKEAVALAKRHVADLFADEGVRNLGLEEVEFDDASGVWKVTIGFSRPWDEPRVSIASIASNAPELRRAYKVVRIADKDGAIVSVTSHKVTA